MDVEFNLRSSQTVAFNINVWLNLVCLDAPLDTLSLSNVFYAQTEHGALTINILVFFQFSPSWGCSSVVECALRM